MSGQTMVARYIRCSVYSTLTWAEEYSRLVQPFCCQGYRNTGERQEVYEHYIPSLLNTPGRGEIFQTKSESLLYEYPRPMEVTGRRGRRRMQILDDLIRYITGNWKKH